MDATHRNGEEQLDALFRAYRNIPSPDPSVNFMPNLWAKIESRQRVTFSFRRMAGAFVTAGLALSVALGVYLSIPRQAPYVSESYVEGMAEASSADITDIIGQALLDRSDPSR
jgi:hypothetical protein